MTVVLRRSIKNCLDVLSLVRTFCQNLGRFKTECIRTDVFHTGPYKTIADVEYAVAGWVDWYNHRRLHSTLGMVPPAEHEHAYYAALDREPQPQ